MNVKTIRFPLKTDEKLTKIALKLGRTKIDTFIQMVDYFYASKKDPKDINDELLKNTLLKNHKDYIAFIKTQESELLIPIKRDVGRMVNAQQLIVNLFNEEVMAQNRKMLTQQLAYQTAFESHYKLMLSIKEKMNSKEMLKSQMISIFNSYGKSRDNLGLMPSSKDKNELLQQSIHQIQNL